MTDFRSVGVIGGGAWGTSLAQAAARAGLDVVIQAREPEVVESINARNENELFLPEVPLDPAIRAVADLSGLADRDFILSVAPVQHTRAVLTAFAPAVRDGLPIVLCSKGIENSTLKLMSDVLAEALPQARAAVLSGPSFAADVSRGRPAAVTLACPDEALGEALVHALASPNFRPYWADDMIGAQVGGALKNVLAIGCGVVDGREMGKSAHAALVTRGFAEIVRFTEELGGKAETVGGLCGLGDLVLTCSSPQSRNMSVGLALGQGKTLDEVLSGKRSVAEGVGSAPAVRRLAAELGIHPPICEAVAAILAGEIDVDTAVKRLLTRPLRPEH